MQSAFASVIWVVCGVGIILAFAALLTARKTWEDYGKHRMVSDREGGSSPRPGSAAALAERDIEIRQMLEARNARRLRRGEEPLDVEQELRHLVGPHIDSELRSEIRDLVVARNHRRTMRGKPPLDVEREIEREIAKLGNL
jgi:hypothetical protein